VTAPAMADEVLDVFLAAVAAGDRRRAMAAVDGGRQGGLDMRTLYLGVLQPALREVGRRWETGAMTVAQEHLATAITQTAMSRLAGEHFRDTEGGPVLIAACVGAERHALGLRMVCDLLELEGWTSLYLGPTVPAGDLARMVAERRPQAVALSVSLPPHLLGARTAIGDIRALGPPQPVVLVGGRAVAGPEIAQRLGADLTASDAGEAVALLKQRLQ
jgi:MerR family transcriptional regulator, light-induced transcriptional regulator